MATRLTSRRRGPWLLAACLSALFISLTVSLWLTRSSRRLPYHDHFAANRMDEWTAFGGAWQVSNGYILNDSDDIGTKLITGKSSLGNYRMTSDVRLTNSFGDAGLLVMVTNAEEGTNAFDGYYAGLRLPNQLLLGKMDYGFNPLARVDISGGVKPGVWYRMSIEVRDCHIVATARTPGGTTLATASVFDKDSCYTHGAFGLRSFAAGGSWKNISVEELP